MRVRSNLGFIFLTTLFRRCRCMHGHHTSPIPITNVPGSSFPPNTTFCGGSYYMHWGSSAPCSECHSPTDDNAPFTLLATFTNGAQKKRATEMAFNCVDGSELRSCTDWKDSGRVVVGLTSNFTQTPLLGFTTMFSPWYNEKIYMTAMDASGGLSRPDTINIAGCLCEEFTTTNCERSSGWISLTTVATVILWCCFGTILLTAICFFITL